MENVHGYTIHTSEDLVTKKLMKIFELKTGITVVTTWEQRSHCGGQCRDTWARAWVRLNWAILWSGCSVTARTLPLICLTSPPRPPIGRDVESRPVIGPAHKPVVDRTCASHICWAASPLQPSSALTPCTAPCTFQTLLRKHPAFCLD